MLRFIDNFLNRTTMYKLVEYVLFALLFVAFILSIFGLLPFTPWALAYSTIVLSIVAWVTNKVFAYVFKAHTNVESFLITALILALIISPPQAYEYLSIVPFLIWTSILAMAAKYVIAINKKHIFNPAAFAVALTAIAIGQSATWWIGTLYILPFVLVGGFLITKKIRRFDLVIGFTIAALISILFTSSVSDGLAGLLTVFKKIFVDSPIVFFALVMLTEPLTTPATRTKRIVYGAFTGLLFAPSLHIGSLYSTPELALLIGNALSFVMSPMRKYLLTLKESFFVAKNTAEFVFVPDRPVEFTPGQYIEWTLQHGQPDIRGNRRFFTIASSPTEPVVSLGVRYSSDNSSSFKKSLATLKPGDTIMAGQLAGDFTLPNDPKRKLAFIAGGIGITPFRSMTRYLLDKGEQRDIVLLYSNNLAEEIVFKDVFEEASRTIGLRWINTLTKADSVPKDWTDETGQIDGKMIIRSIPDYLERTFYISGPNAMVKGCKETLRSMGISNRAIKTDYFPGFV